MWRADGSAQVLEGHEGPVQCLLLLPDGSLLSGGNDTTIRLWVDGKCQHIFRGHTDTVRCDHLSSRPAGHDPAGPLGCRAAVPTLRCSLRELEPATVLPFGGHLRNI